MNLSNTNRFTTVAQRSVTASMALALALLAGCKTYRPSPLDLPAHKQAWRDFEPTQENVSEFAKRLGKTSPGNKAYNPKNGLSLAEGETIALIFNPDLRVARLRAGVAKVAAKHAGRWDDPELSIDVLNITSSVPDPWVVGSALAFTIPVSGRLGVEKRRAEAAMHAELERVAEAEWMVTRKLRDAWLSWSADRYRLQQTEAILTSLDTIIKTTSRLAEAAELPKIEAALFKIERESQRADIARWKGAVSEGEQQLRAVLGLSPQATVKLVPALYAVPEPSAKDEPDATNLTLARLRSDYEVAEKTLLREIRKQYPDVTIGPQGESDQGQSRIGFVGAVPIPILNSNKGGIAEAKAEREVARAAYETEYQRIVGRLAALRSRLHVTSTRRDTIDDNLIPLVDRQVGDARQLLELGEGGSLVLLESILRAHEAKLQLIDIQLKHAETKSEIRYLLGPHSKK